VMLQAAAYLLGKNPVRYVFLDGRAFSRRYQIERVLQVAGELHQPWRILECVCSDETVRKRLESQAGEHPAGNRDYILYRDVKSRFEEILSTKSVIDTEHGMEESIQQGLAALR
jgi:predicted kinase